jgi:hypothetical protein
MFYAGFYHYSRELQQKKTYYSTCIIDSLLYICSYLQCHWGWNIYVHQGRRRRRSRMHPLMSVQPPCDKPATNRRTQVVPQPSLLVIRANHACIFQI